jgi:excisionase family DNA binding protein
MHAAVAIRDHARRLRRDRVPVPSDLLKLAAALMAACPDRSGQERPDSRGQAPPYDAEGGTPAPVMLRAPEAAAVLGCSVRQLRRKTASGEVPSVKDGRSRRYLTRDLILYAEAKANRDVPGPVRPS